MNEPLVSIIMITYNHAPYIAQAIEGCLLQKVNFPYELVIGEDYSRDGTREIVFEYKRRYPDIIRVITSDKNVGAKKNSYRTLKACMGKYIAFCEGDDYWHHCDKLQEQVDYMEHHPESGMVVTDCDVLNVRSNELIKNYNYRRGYKLPKNLTTDEIINGKLIFTCTVMARRSLCEQVVERDPYLHQSEHFLMGDHQLWAELSLISRVAYIPKSFATYRILEESLSMSRCEKKVLQFLKNGAEMKLYLCDKHKLSEDIRKKVELRWCDYSLKLAYYEKNAKLASEVKKKKHSFTWEEWLRYFGAKYSVVRNACNLAAFLRVSFRKLFKTPK